jgi:hypothetical protein
VFETPPKHLYHYGMYRNTMATVIHEVIQLSSAFDNASIRKCIVDDEACVSVIDIIRALTFAEAKGVWRAIKNQYPELKQATKSFKFHGVGSRDTPVANANTILEIIFKIPGAKAREFSTTAAHTFIQTLNPTREFINELEDRARVLEIGDVDVDGQLSVFQASNNVNTYSILVVTLTSLHQNAATRRVSVRVYLRQTTDP